MGATFQTFPIYAIFDRSFNQSVSTLGNGSIVLTGTPGLMVDGDLTTCYDITGVGTDGKGIGFVIDYGKNYLNCQLSYKAIFVKNNGSGNATYTVDYSTDGTNWTNIDTASIGTGSPATVTNSKTILQMRYARFKIAFDSLNLTTQVYECRLMGTG